MPATRGETCRWTDAIAAERAEVGLPVGTPDRYLIELKPKDQSNNHVYEVRNGEAVKLVDPRDFDPTGRSWIGRWDPSPDGKKIAVQICDPDESNNLYIVDRQTGEVTEGPVDRCRFSEIAWLPDSSGFYYSRTDPELWLYRNHLLLHTLGQSPDLDREFEIPEAAADPDHPMLAPRLYGDGRWLVVARSNTADTYTMLHIADLHDPAPDGSLRFRSVETRTPWASRLPVEAPDGRLLVVANDAESDRGAVWAVRPHNLPNRRSWSLLIPEPRDLRTTIGAVAARWTSRGARYIVTSRREGTSWLTVHGGSQPQIVQPPRVQAANVRGLSVLGDKLLVRWSTPGATFTTQRGLVGSRMPELWGLPEGTVPGVPTAVEEAQAADRFEVRAIPFQPADGAPESVIWVSHLRGRKGSLPTLLTGYGVLGIPTELEHPMLQRLFDAWREAGGAVATAVLPGGDFGQEEGIKHDGSHAEEHWLRARDALVTSGVATESGIAAATWSGPGNALLNLAIKHPKAFAALALVAPMVGFRNHDLSALATHPERAPNDCSALWKFAENRIDAHALLEAVGWRGKTHVIFGIPKDDTRVSPEHNGLRMWAALKQRGARVSLVVAPGGHRISNAAPELLGRMAALTASELRLPAPRAGRAEIDAFGPLRNIWKDARTVERTGGNDYRRPPHGFGRRPSKASGPARPVGTGTDVHTMASSTRPRG